MMMTGWVVMKREPSRSEYTLEITASDSGSYPRKSTTLVTIIKGDPDQLRPELDLSNLRVVLPEDLPRGSSCGYVKIKGNEVSRVETCIYNIIGGNNYRHFNINSMTGEIFLANSLDFEFVQSYRLQLEGSCSRTKIGSNPGSFELVRLPSLVAGVNISIEDVNDNRPVFKEDVLVLSLDADCPIGTSVGQVEAYDEDGYENARIKYEIRSQHPPGTRWLSIDEQTGVLLASVNLRHTSVENISVVVVATDQAKDVRRRLSSTARFVLLINHREEDSIDRPDEDSMLNMEPVGVERGRQDFARTSYNVSLMEELPIGSLVISLGSPSDDDSCKPGIVVSKFSKFCSFCLF